MMIRRGIEKEVRSCLAIQSCAISLLSIFFAFFHALSLKYFILLNSTLCIAYVGIKNMFRPFFGMGFLTGTRNPKKND